MSQIERIKEQVLLESLLPPGQLNYSGSSKIPCPLPGHTKDRTPSFHVYTENNTWTCFGCRRSGSVIDLQMELNGQTFVEALRDLAKMAGIELEPLTPEQQAKAAEASLRAAALSFYVGHCMDRLYPRASGVHHDAGRAALDYLKARGLSEETLERHQVGLDDGTFLRTLEKLKPELEALGLAIPDLLEVEYEPGKWRPHELNRTGLGIIRHHLGGRFRSFFGQRIIIPVISAGKIVGLTARALPGASDKAPKYLHLKSPMACLYNEDAVRKDKAVWVVEGPMDAMALTQVGAVGVAQFGTGGIQRARRLDIAPAVYLLLDQDKAGEDATIRAGKHLTLKGIVPYVVQMPKGEDAPKDPGEWLLKGMSLEALDAIAVGAEPWPKAYAKAFVKAAPHQREPVVQQLTEAARELSDGPAFRAVAEALAILGITKTKAATAATKSLSKEAFAKGEIADDQDDTPGLVPCYQITEQLDGTHVVRFTTWLEVRYPEGSAKKGLVDGKLTEPVMIESRQDGDGRSYRSTVLDMEALGPSERSRVPWQADVEGRWRYKEGPWAIKHLLAGNAPELNLHELHRGIRSLFGRYVWMRDNRVLDMLACYTMLTYLYDMWDALPYLHLWGTRESAKSNVGGLLDLLCLNSTMASSSSESVLFRGIHNNRGLRILEEAEGLADPKPGSTEEKLRLIANGGYKRGAKAQRIDPESKDFAVQSFDTYGPKVFASINHLEHVLASRCIRVHMVRANLSDLRASGIKDMVQDSTNLKRRALDLRDQLYVMALQRVESFSEASKYLADDHPALENLMGRQREMWMPLLSVALATMVDQATAQAEAELGAAWDRMDSEAQGDAIRDRIGALERDETSLFCSLVALQKHLEKVAKTDETEASIEATTLKLLHGIIKDGDEINPLSSDMLGRSAWAIATLADVVSKALGEQGFTGRGGKLAMPGRRLTSLLEKTGVINSGDRQDFYLQGVGKQRGVWIRVSALEETMKRMGVVWSNEPEAPATVSMVPSDGG